MTRLSALATAAAALLATSAAAVTADSPRSSEARVRKTVVTVSVTPGTAALAPSAALTFAATVTGTTQPAVTWSASCGTITSAGVFTAPASAASCTVVARSVADTTKSASASVTVSGSVAVSVSPASLSLDACGTASLSASVTGATNTAVTWYVVEAGGGTVTTSGAYVAPTTPGTYHVMAVSQADSSKYAQATIVVGGEKVLSVSATPGDSSLSASGQLAFAALVTTSCRTFAAQ